MKGAELGVSVNTRGTFHLVVRIYRPDRSSTKENSTIILFVNGILDSGGNLPFRYPKIQEPVQPGKEKKITPILTVKILDFNCEKPLNLREAVINFDITVLLDSS